MKISVIAVGKSLSSWLNEGYQEYAKRMPTPFALHLIEVTASKRTKTATIEQYKLQEAERILSQVKENEVVIALDQSGENWSTTQLSHLLQQWHDEARSISFIIGGPDGLDKRVISRANKVWSLSRLTFPHPLVRIILAEQLYRAWSLTVGHPYHK